MYNFTATNDCMLEAMSVCVCALKDALNVTLTCQDVLHVTLTL